jgi:hypothetical protein
MRGLDSEMALCLVVLLVRQVVIVDFPIDLAAKNRRFLKWTVTFAHAARTHANFTTGGACTLGL